jgi:hypothetical protein
MKRPLIAVIIVMMLATLACSINISLPTMKLGPTKTFTIDEPVPSGVSTADVSLNMGAGTLDLSPGGNALVSGTITYNLAQWEPKVTQNGNGVTISQGEQTIISGIPSEKLINDWVVNLNNSVPMDLTIQAGAYKGTMDMSGLHLTNLDITDGASQNTVSFNSLNPEIMQSFTYQTGASQVHLKGLANANFATMNFEGGAGDYSFDFSGTSERDATVYIKTGVSNVTISVPVSMSVTFINSGGLSNINTMGTWTVNGNTYTSASTSQGHMLTIHAETAVGSVKLIHQ